MPFGFPDPSGHSWWKKWGGQIIGAVLGVIATCIGGPLLGAAVYSGVSSGLTAALNGMPIGRAIEIGVISGIAGYAGGAFGAELGGALDLGQIGTGALAGAFGGAAAGATGAALGGGDVGRGALAGFLSGAIAGAGAGAGGGWAVVGNMVGGGVGSEVAGGKFVEGAIGGLMYTMGSAIGQQIMSGNLQGVASNQRGNEQNNDALRPQSFAERMISGVKNWILTQSEKLQFTVNILPNTEVTVYAGVRFDSTNGFVMESPNISFPTGPKNYIISNPGDLVSQVLTTGVQLEAPVSIEKK